MPKRIDEETVFKAVITLLLQRGYDRTTTSDMAAAANMHEATLFRKFGSKVGLIERAIAQQLSATPLGQVRYSGDLRSDLLAILNAYAATVAEHGEIMPLLLGEIPRHPELSHTLQTPLANLAVVTKILARHQAEGHLKPESPQNTVYALLAPLMVEGMYRRTIGQTDTPAIEPEAYIDAFLHGRSSAAN